MALTKNADSSKFEDGPDNGAAETSSETTQTQTADERVAAAVERQAAANPDAPATPKTEVVAAKPNAVVVQSSIAKKDPFLQIENALHVDYNTLMPLMASNGNIIKKEGQKLLGDTIKAELISIQKHWVMSPGGKTDDPESMKFLKFSDDGKTVRGTGELLTSVQEAAVNAGFTEARIVEREIIVGMLLDCLKEKDLIGELFQMDLAPGSCRNLQRYRLTQAAKFAMGTATQADADNALKVTIQAVPMSKGKFNWTDAVFSKF